MTSQTASSNENVANLQFSEPEEQPSSNIDKQVEREETQRLINDNDLKLLQKQLKKARRLKRQLENEYNHIQASLQNNAINVPNVSPSQSNDVSSIQTIKKYTITSAETKFTHTASTTSLIPLKQGKQIHHKSGMETNIRENKEENGRSIELIPEDIFLPITKKPIYRSKYLDDLLQEDERRKTEFQIKHQQKLELQERKRQYSDLVNRFYRNNADNTSLISEIEENIVKKNYEERFNRQQRRPEPEIKSIDDPPRYLPPIRPKKEPLSRPDGKIVNERYLDSELRSIQNQNQPILIRYKEVQRVSDQWREAAQRNEQRYRNHEHQEDPNQFLSAASKYYSHAIQAKLAFLQDIDD